MKHILMAFILSALPSLAQAAESIQYRCTLYYSDKATSDETEVSGQLFLANGAQVAEARLEVNGGKYMRLYLYQDPSNGVMIQLSHFDKPIELGSQYDYTNGLLRMPLSTALNARTIESVYDKPFDIRSIRYNVSAYCGISR